MKLPKSDSEGGRAIEGMKEVCDVFSMFHDGVVSGYHFSDGLLVLTIEIFYLAERVSPEFTSFQVHLDHVEELAFLTWPNEIKSGSLRLTNLDAIFALELEILEASVREGSIVLACSQDDLSYDYCGGELKFRANSAKVLDEAGKSYSTDELRALCSAYWQEFSRK